MCAQTWVALIGLALVMARPVHAQDDTVTKTPEPIENLAVAAEGKFVILKITGEEGLSVYDTAARKIIKKLRLPTTEFLFAAGGETVLVYLKEDNQFQTWSLKTFEKTKSGANPLAMKVHQLVMGHGRGDTAFVFCASGDRFGSSPSEIYLLDTATLANARAQQQQQPQHVVSRLDAHGNPQLRADRYLNRIAFWSSNVSPGGVNLITVSDKGYEFRGMHEAAGHIVAGDDGNLYSGIGRVFGTDPVANPQFGNAISSKGYIEGHMLFPGLGGVFFLGLQREGKLSIFQSGRTTALCAAAEFPEWSLPKPQRPAGSRDRPGEQVPFPPQQEFTKAPLTYDKRIIFAPHLDYILFVPPTNDRLIQRKLDLKDLLDKGGREYLLVNSCPTPRATAGSPWLYQLTALAKTGTIKYTLETAPEGMKLSPEGLLTWKIPAGIQGRAPVKVHVSDGGEKELRHSFVVEFE